jgi:hypothetical protein
MTARPSTRAPQSVDALAGAYAGRTALVVGTGPSLRALPGDVLVRLRHEWAGLVVVGVNQAWRHAPLDVAVALRPRHLRAHAEARLGGDGHAVGRWALRDERAEPGAPPAAEFDRPDVYAFTATESRRDDLRAAGPGRLSGELFYGGGGQTSALHLAVLMGCRLVLLVGHDMRPLDGEHQGHYDPESGARYRRPVGWPGYGRYLGWTRALRDRLWRDYGVPVVSLTPFVGLDDLDKEQARLKELLGRQRHLGLGLRGSQDLTEDRR